MKKNFIFVALLSLCLAVQTQAQTEENDQDARPQMGRHEKLDASTMANRESDRMRKNLELTDDQYQKVQAINLDFAQKIEAARGAKDADPKVKLAVYTTDKRKGKSKGKSDMRQQMKELDDQKTEAFKAVLTPEQLQKYTEMREKRKENRGTRPQMRDAEPEME
jgi:Spy/CpxP family protein refolding chaperone